MDENIVSIKKGLGSKIISSDRYEYMDFCMSSGRITQGHAYSNAVLAIKKIAVRDLSFYCTSKEQFDFS